MRYYWFSRENLLKNTRDKYHSKGGKEKAAEYYRKNSDLITLETRNNSTSLREKRKNKRKNR